MFKTFRSLSGTSDGLYEEGRDQGNVTLNNHGKNVYGGIPSAKVDPFKFKGTLRAYDSVT